MPKIEIGGNVPITNKCFRSSHQVRLSLRADKAIHSTQDPHQRSLQTVNDLRWVRRPRPIQYDSSLFGAEEYCSYHDGKGQKTIHCQSLQRYLEELIRQGFLKDCPYTRSSFRIRTVERSASYSTTTRDHLIQSNRVI